MATNQAYLFLIFTIIGAIIGLLFDFFRILRKSFRTIDFITYVEDILFWIITGILLIYSICVFCNGEIRLFIILGISIGIILYMLILSHTIIKISVNIIKFIKKILTKILNILIFPFKIIYKVLRNIFKKPISFIIINIRHIFTKYKNNMKNKVKNTKEKKDFKQKRRII